MNDDDEGKSSQIFDTPMYSISYVGTKRKKNFYYKNKQTLYTVFHK